MGRIERAALALLALASLSAAQDAPDVAWRDPRRPELRKQFDLLELIGLRPSGERVFFFDPERWAAMPPADRDKALQEAAREGEPRVKAIAQSLLAEKDETALADVDVRAIAARSSEQAKKAAGLIIAWEGLGGDLPKKKLIVRRLVQARAAPDERKTAQTGDATNGTDDETVSVVPQTGLLTGEAFDGSHASHASMIALPQPNNPAALTAPSPVAAARPPPQRVGGATTPARTPLPPAPPALDFNEAWRQALAGVVPSVAEPLLAAQKRAELKAGLVPLDQLARLDKNDPRFAQAVQAWKDYVAFNRSHLDQFKEGETFAPEELGLDPTTVRGPLTKAAVGRFAGFRYAIPGGSRFVSADGTYTRDSFPAEKRVVEHFPHGTIVVTLGEGSGRQRLTYAPMAGGLTSLKRDGENGVVEVGRFDREGRFVVEGVRGESGRVVRGLVPARDKDGKIVEWRIDAEAISSVTDPAKRRRMIAAISDQLEAVKGLSPAKDPRARYRADSWTSFFAEELSRPVPPGTKTELYYDPGGGALHLTRVYPGGQTQRILARFEASMTGWGDGVNPAGVGLTVYLQSGREAMKYRQYLGAGMVEQVTSSLEANTDGLATKALGPNGGQLLPALEFWTSASTWRGARVTQTDTVHRLYRTPGGSWQDRGEKVALPARTLFDSSGIIGEEAEGLHAFGAAVVDMGASVGNVALASMYNKFGLQDQVQDQLERFNVNFFHNAFNRYLETKGLQSENYRNNLRELQLDETKYVQNVGEEVRLRGHARIGAVLQGGVDFADQIPGLVLLGNAGEFVGGLSPVGNAANQLFGAYMQGSAVWGFSQSGANLWLNRNDLDSEEGLAAIRGMTTETLMAPMTFAIFSQLGRKGTFLGFSDPRAPFRPRAALTETPVEPVPTPEERIDPTGSRQVRAADEVLATRLREHVEKVRRTGKAFHSGDGESAGLAYKKALRTAPEVAPADLDAAAERGTVVKGPDKAALQSYGVNDCTIHAVANALRASGFPEVTVEDVYAVLQREAAARGGTVVGNIRRGGMDLFDTYEVYEIVARHFNRGVEAVPIDKLFSTIAARRQGATVTLHVGDKLWHQVFVEGLVVRDGRQFVSIIDSNAGRGGGASRIFLEIGDFAAMADSGGTMISGPPTREPGQTGLFFNDLAGDPKYSPKPGASPRPGASSPAESFVDRIERLKTSERWRSRGDRDILLELETAVRQGKTVHGKFYRVIDAAELPKWMKGGTGLPQPELYKWAGPRDVVARVYGHEGAILIEIEGDAVPYASGSKEGEMGVLRADAVKVVDRNLKSADATDRLEVSAPTDDDVAFLKSLGVQLH